MKTRHYSVFLIAVILEFYEKYTYCDVHASELKTYFVSVGTNEQSDSTNVYGVDSCGGDGRFVEWFIDDCRDQIDTSPCRLTAGNTLATLSYIDFVPGIDSNQLGLRVNLASEGGKIQKNFDEHLKSFSATGESQYEVALAHLFSSNFPKGNITMQYEVYDIENLNATIICVEAPFEVV